MEAGLQAAQNAKRGFAAWATPSGTQNTGCGPTQAMSLKGGSQASPSFAIVARAGRREDVEYIVFSRGCDDEYVRETREGFRGQMGAGRGDPVQDLRPAQQAVGAVGGGRAWAWRCRGRDLCEGGRRRGFREAGRGRRVRETAPR